MKTNDFSRRQDVWIGIGLFVFTLLSRVPFRSQILYHWDAVNFAYGMREFRVAKEQPQPPGYILYVWLCRLVDLLFGDAQTTMVWISIVASALAAVALFYLGRSMFGRRAGLVAALLLATSPLFWFYGEIALPHTLDTLLVIVSVWWLYETMQGDHRYLYPAIAIMAIAGGVRQQTLVFLAPLLLFALRRVGWKRFLTAGMLGAVICLAWFVPLMTLSDGFANYMSVMGAYNRRFQDTTSIFMGAGWGGIKYNVRKLAMYTLYGWNVALVPGIVYAARRFWYREWLQRWEKPVFLTLWVAPALFFYTSIHMGQQGLIFVFLPALLLISVVALIRLLTTRPRWLMAATAALVALNAGIFCLVPEYPLGPGTQRLLTRATLVNSDRYYQDRFRAIEENFAPESTAILADNWHHVEYYLPKYVRLPFRVVGKRNQDWGNPVGNPQDYAAVSPSDLKLQPDSEGRVAVVIFDPVLVNFNDSSEVTTELDLENGSTLAYFVLEKGQKLRYGPSTFGVIR
ncbi:MAG: glycosyltransferase family 39 protein [Chloroflexota bacterium]|nr:glycosyltransferase family 39 protein [Chloroflexota bacterium]